MTSAGDLILSPQTSYFVPWDGRLSQVPSLNFTLAIQRFFFNRYFSGMQH